MAFFSWWPGKSKSDATDKKVEDIKRDFLEVAKKSTASTKKVNKQIEENRSDIAILMFKAVRKKGEE